MLSELEVSRGAKRRALPQSKKTRALLAYLVATGRPHRRERLCSLLWDVTDDPRGALRWSLSKLRSQIDGPGGTHILADRESVSFNADGVFIDLFAIRDCLAAGIDQASTDRLKQLAALFRGEFLEGLDLADFHDFQSWCIAEREQARTDHVAILNGLLKRLASHPNDALPFARSLVQVDSLNEGAHATLIGLLAALNRRSEAELQHSAACRLLKELGAPPTGELEDLRRKILQRPAQVAVNTPSASAPADIPPAVTDSEGPGPGILVGRTAERARLAAALTEVMAHRRERIVLLTGEPGVGKSRLLADIAGAVRNRGGTILDGCAYEAESRRPFGPWIDALRRVPAPAMGKTIGTDLLPLLPELPHEVPEERSRDRMFGAVVELLSARAHSASPVLLALDDVQWCDDASVELLHYTIRMNRHRPLLVALAARGGELPDNGAMHRVIQSLRRDGLLEEIRLGPLNREETDQLVHSVSAAADAARVYALSAGNPLFALELARAAPHYSSDDMPPTLANLVHERIDRLPASTADVLRWAAIMGQIISVRRLGELTGKPPEGLVGALELLERRALLHATPQSLQPRGDYTFAHDAVRRVVYTELSEPRRRLMHRRVAQSLFESAGKDETVAGEIAHHAALGGDASMASRACVVAGRHCLRLFANGEAELLVRRGVHYAEQLDEPERVQRMIELAEIMIAAHRPERAAEEARKIAALAERALDHGCHEHARLGFQLVGYLHWDRGDWSDAERHMLRAEQVSRAGDEKAQALAMAEAARCLALLERDLARAEALVLQAGAMAARLDIRPIAVPDAEGMLRLHEGNLDEAELHFEQARLLARTAGDRLNEFQALEHLVMVQLQRGNYDSAVVLSDELVAIGDRLRDGSEASYSRALAALSRCARGESDAGPQLDQALARLREADAKHRLAFILTRAAELDLRDANPRRAREHASEALAAARQLARPSEIVLALVLMVQAAARLKDTELAQRCVQELRSRSLVGVSRHVQEAVKTLREGGAAKVKRAGR
jgi:DNA-binding SARP family transcriptional activator